MESEQEAQERLWRQQQQQHVPNPPMPPKKVPEKTTRPRNKSIVKKQTGKEPRAFPKVLKDAPRSHHKKGFRFQGKTGFLTYPQYKGDLTPVEVMERVKSFFEKTDFHLESCIVAKENHSNDSKEGVLEDPGVHYHIIFKTKKPIDSTNCRIFDELVGQHGDYVTCRKFLSSVIYATKENNYTVFNLDVSAIRKAIESKASVSHHTIANKILEKPNRALEKVARKWPGYMIQHQHKVEDFIEMVQGFEHERKIPYYGVEIPWPDLEHPGEHAIASWVHNNFGKPRLHKQKQLFVWGPKNMGKSHILMDLEKRFKRYIIGDEEKFDPDYNDANVEFCTFDEFVGQKKVSWINSFTEGTRMRLNKKGSRNGMFKNGNPPIIFCSNKSLDQIYSELKEKSPFQFEALLERFQQVELKRQFRLKFLDKPIEEMREEEGLNPDPRAQEEGGEQPYANDESFAEVLSELSDLNYKGELVIEDDDEEEESEELPPPPPPSKTPVLKRTKRINLVQEDFSDEEPQTQQQFVRPKRVPQEPPKKRRKKFLSDSEEEEEDLK